eukprot:15327214-Ditylum_brightwellii.AAC.1
MWLRIQKVEKLAKIFRYHPSWDRFMNLLVRGSLWPTEDLDEEERQKDVDEAPEFGNHKGAILKPDPLKKLTSKDAKHSYSLPLLLSKVKKIPGLMMAPMNIMRQNTKEKIGMIVDKDKLTHD